MSGTSVDRIVGTLISVVAHKGDASQGHFICYSKLDDSDVFYMNSYKGWSLKFPNFVFAYLLVSCYYVDKIELIAHGNILFLRFPKWGETSL